MPNINKHFEAFLGQHPKRARVGYGSFLTFDFGQASKQHHRLHYEWHLWIQYVDWQLTWQKQQIADSESKRHLMQAAVERLESKTLKKVMHHPSDRTTSFIFSGDVELKCQAYSDSAADEHCWSLYTPDMHVLFADRSGKLLRAI
jgi:hypothetical protein